MFAMMVLISIFAIVFALMVARPSPTIKITAHSNGNFTCESHSFTEGNLRTALVDAVAWRKRWFVTPRAQIVVDPELEFATVQQVLSIVVAAGCEEVQFGLPQELSQKLSKPELTSEPW